MKMRQEKMKDDLETEVIRIMNDYGRRGMIKNVDIGVYLMSLFGHSEAMRYLNRFKLRGRGVF